MGNGLTGVIKDALRLHPADRAKLIDALYASLESTDIQILEKAWAREAESRLDAFDDGRIGSDSWDELKEKLKNKP
ncbi:MAG: addiction module protein [Spirochaetales bacterium]|nr:addiction module protein [Spirochaetales bacterium]